MPPRKMAVKSTAAMSSTGTAVVESPATDTSARRVTRKPETPVEFLKLPNKSPNRRLTAKSNPTPKAKAVPLKENIPPAASTLFKRDTAEAPPPAQTPHQSEDEAEASPRQSARARKQTARATESWALKKTKEKAERAKQNQAPSITKNIPSPKKAAGKRRTLDHLDHLDHLDEADAAINAEANGIKLAYEEDLKRMKNNKKRGSMWPAEDSYDDGRLPDTEEDEKARAILASNTATSLPAKKTLKRVTKRQSLTKENDDDVEMDTEDSEAIPYGPKSAKNGTPTAKRRKVVIDAEEDEEIVASDLSPSKQPAKRAFATAKAQTRIKCYCNQTAEPGRAGWKRKHIEVGVKEVCSACSENSAPAIAKKVKQSLIAQAKEKIKASQSERDSVEESSSRSRKNGDKEASEMAEERGDEVEKQKKTARNKSLEKARAAKAQKTYKSKSMENLRNQNGNSATRQRSLSAAIPGIESEHDLDNSINNDSEPTPSITADGPRRSRRGVDLTSETRTREESGPKMTRAASTIDPSTFYDDDGELMYHVCPYYIQDEHQGLIWGVPQGAKNKRCRKPKPWQWCVKEPSVREGRMGGGSKVCLWEDLEPIREDWWDEEKREMRWLSGFETVRIDRRKLATPMRKLTTPIVDEGPHSEMGDGDAYARERGKSKDQPLMSKEQREIENEKVKSRQGKAPVPKSDTWTAMIMDLRRNTQSGEIFMMVAPWWTRDEVKFQLGQFGRGYLNKRWPATKPWEFMLGAHFEVVPWEALIDRVEARNDPRFCHEMMYGAETLNYEVFGRNVGRGSYNLDGVDLNTEDRALWRSWKRQGSRKGLTDEGRRQLEEERDRHEERERATFAKLFWTRELWNTWLERRRRIDLEPEELEAEDRAREEAERKAKREAMTEALRDAKREAGSLLTPPKMADGNEGSEDDEDQAFQPFQVRAIWEHISRHKDDLSFSNGQIITVTDEEDENWYVGEYTDAKGVKREGILPRNRVKRYTMEPDMELDY